MVAFIKNKNYFFLIAVLFLSTALASYSQTEQAQNSDSPADTVFNEILLNEEGVTAIDTAGYEWYYDFEYSMFVTGLPPIPEGDVRPPVRLGDEYLNLPIHERATVLKKVKRFETGSVTVQVDEYVDRDIKCWGKVTIRGWVRGNVLSIDERVLVTETGQVDGDIEAPRVVVKDGGTVLGHIREVDLPIPLEEITSSFSHVFLLVMIIITLSILLIGFIVLALMPRQLTNVEACVAHYRGRSTALGILFFIMMPAIIVLLSITIIGVALVPVLPFVYLWAIILGIVSFGKELASRLHARVSSSKTSPIFLGLIGIFLLMSPWIVTAALMGTSSDIVNALGAVFLAVSIVLMIFPVFSGIGAAYLTRFGFREYVSGKRHSSHPGSGPSAEPAPPPIPDAPLGQNKETPPASSRISEKNEDS